MCLWGEISSIKDIKIIVRHYLLLMSDLLENGFQSQVKSDNSPQSSGKEKSIIKAAMPGTESAKSLTTQLR